MTKTRDMTPEEWKKKDKKLKEVEELLMEFFEVNDIIPVDAMDAMLRLLVTMFRKSKATEKELETLFNCILVASTSRQ